MALFLLWNNVGIQIVLGPIWIPCCYPNGFGRLQNLQSGNHFTLENITPHGQLVCFFYAADSAIAMGGWMEGDGRVKDENISPADDSTASLSQAASTLQPEIKYLIFKQ